LENDYFDAFPNLYDVSITLPEPIQAQVDALATTLNSIPEAVKIGIAIRASSVTFPELTVGTYPVAYKGVELSRPNSEITGERKLSIKFRLDSDYYYINILKAWKEMYGSDAPTVEVLDLNPLAYSEKNEENSGTILITSNRDSKWYPKYNDAPGWEFYHVQCTKIGYPTYAREGSSVIEIEAQFIFESYKFFDISSEASSEFSSGNGEIQAI